MWDHKCSRHREPLYGHFLVNLIQIEISICPRIKWVDWFVGFPEPHTQQYLEASQYLRKILLAQIIKHVLFFAFLLKLQHQRNLCFIYSRSRICYVTRRTSRQKAETMGSNPIQKFHHTTFIGQVHFSWDEVFTWIFELSILLIQLDNSYSPYNVYYY